MKDFEFFRISACVLYCILSSNFNFCVYRVKFSSQERCINVKHNLCECIITESGAEHATHNITDYVEPAMCAAFIPYCVQYLHVYKPQNPQNAFKS